MRGVFYTSLWLNEKDGASDLSREDIQESLRNTLMLNKNVDEIELLTRALTVIKRRQSVANNLAGAMIFILLLWFCTWWGDWSEVMPFFGIVPMVCLFGVWDFNRRCERKDWNI